MYFDLHVSRQQAGDRLVQINLSLPEHRLIRRVCLQLLQDKASTHMAGEDPQTCALLARYVEHSDASDTKGIIPLYVKEIRQLQKVLLQYPDYEESGIKATELASALAHELDAFELRVELSRISPLHFDYQS